jgi:hypothetical protein
VTPRSIYWKYLKYLLWHKWCVFRECYKRGIIWRGIKHDLSKFLPSEFIPHARYFHGKWPTRQQVKSDSQYWGGYPDELTREAVKEAWEIASLKHMNHSDHHWQHWLWTNKKGKTKPLRMTTGAWKEMLADWDGSGVSITGNLDTLEWYSKNRDNIILDPLVKQLTDEHIGILPPLARK